MKTKFYAIVNSNHTVVDCGFDGGDIIISAIKTDVNYPKTGEYTLVEMTLENSPAQLGMKYTDNKFIFEENINA